MRTFSRRLIGVFLPVLLLAGCGGGGGGGGGGLGFTVVAISPAVSQDLGGGDSVTITGTNFLTVLVGNVTFGGVAGTNRQILSETEMTVQTPAAPGGVPQAVTVVLTSVHGGTQQLVDGYTYAVSGPSPQAIAPTAFTPTGAEDFTITGTTLGPLGGQVTVLFQGIGSVTGDVSLDGQTVTGRAPVSAVVPPIGPLTVTVDTGAATADVPSTVTYTFVQPFVPAGAPGQTLGNASQPVRFADGFAALCTAGLNGTWGDADDDIRIVRGPPNAIQVLSVSPRTAPGTQVGFLSPTNSIPAVLGPDTFCVYSPGAAVPGYVLVTLARTAPVADLYPHPGINAAPIAALGPNRIAYMTSGLDGLFGPATGGNTGDDLFVMDFNLALVPPPLIIAGGGAGRVPLAGAADLAPGAANFSIPLTADGDTVIVMGTGLDAIAGNADDTFTSVMLSTGVTHLRIPAPFLFARPIMISPTLFAAPGAGPNGTFGNLDDTLSVYALGAGWTNTPHALGRPLNSALAVVPYARIGNGVALAAAGPTSILAYTDPLAGTKTTLQFAGAPLFAPLGNGGLLVFGPGGDLAYRTADDVAIQLDAATAAPTSFVGVPNQFQGIAPLTDGDRAFALAPGGDNAFGTNDDLLEVYQSRALNAGTNTARLPVAALPAQVLGLGVTFVPVGSGWGLIQSPGPSGVWGDANDLLILVSY